VPERDRDEVEELERVEADMRAAMKIEASMRERVRGSGPKRVKEWNPHAPR